MPWWKVRTVFPFCSTKVIVTSVSCLGLPSASSHANVKTSRSGSMISRNTLRDTNSPPSGPLARVRQRPPGRKSSSHDRLTAPRGPHHCLMRSGSVHALKTRLQGASKTRVITSSRSVVGEEGLFFSAMLLLLSLDIAQIFTQAVQAVFPERAIVFEPVDRLL